MHFLRQNGKFCSEKNWNVVMLSLTTFILEQVHSVAEILLFRRWYGPEEKKIYLDLLFIETNCLKFVKTSWTYSRKNNQKRGFQRITKKDRFCSKKYRSGIIKYSAKHFWITYPGKVWIRFQKAIFGSTAQLGMNRMSGLFLN